MTLNVIKLLIVGNVIWGVLGTLYEVEHILEFVNQSYHKLQNSKNSGSTYYC